jgi:hypothetical protein
VQRLLTRLRVQTWRRRQVHCRNPGHGRKQHSDYLCSQQSIGCSIGLPVFLSIQGQGKLCQANEPFSASPGRSEHAMCYVSHAYGPSLEETWIARAEILLLRSLALFSFPRMERPCIISHHSLLQVYQLYTHSFAGYGYNDARKAILQEANSVTDGWSQPTVLIDPCALQGGALLSCKGCFCLSLSATQF